MQAPGVALAPSTAARGQQTEAEPGIQVQVPASGVVALPTAAELAPVVVWRRRRLEAAATLQASRLEKARSRTRDRALLQMEQLTESIGKASADLPPQLRMR